MKRAESEILTVDDLAELFVCDKETAAARLTSGDLPGVKVGRGWIIPRQALFERLNEKAREEAAVRRAHHTSVVGAAEQRGRTDQATSTRPTNNALVAYQINTLPKLRGRKRREPPALPLLPAKNEGDNL